MCVCVTKTCVCLCVSVCECTHVYVCVWGLQGEFLCIFACVSGYACVCASERKSVRLRVRPLVQSTHALHFVLPGLGSRVNDTASVSVKPFICGCS